MYQPVFVVSNMMMSSHGKIFRYTGPVSGINRHRWIPLTKASDAELWCFSLICAWKTVEQTIKTPVIWDAIALISIWRHCNVYEYIMCDINIVPVVHICHFGHMIAHPICGTIMPWWWALQIYFFSTMIVQIIVGWFSVKILSYQYRKYHCGDETILPPSYIHNGIVYTDDTFYIELGLWWKRSTLHTLRK